MDERRCRSEPVLDRADSAARNGKLMINRVPMWLALAKKPTPLPKLVSGYRYHGDTDEGLATWSEPSAIPPIAAAIMATANQSLRHTRSRTMEQNIASAGMQAKSELNPS